MMIETAASSEVIWLDARQELSLTDMLELSGLSIAELQHLVACDVLSPIGGTHHTLVEPAVERGAASPRFSAECLALARTASHLRSTFELDVNGLTLTLRLLNRILELEVELRDLRAQQPR
jgi:hypothetical protein